MESVEKVILFYESGVKISVELEKVSTESKVKQKLQKYFEKDFKYDYRCFTLKLNKEPYFTNTSISDYIKTTFIYNDINVNFYQNKSFIKELNSKEEIIKQGGPVEVVKSLFSRETIYFDNCEQTSETKRCSTFLGKKICLTDTNLIPIIIPYPITFFRFKNKSIFCYYQNNYYVCFQEPTNITIDYAKLTFEEFKEEMSELKDLNLRNELKI